MTMVPAGNKAKCLSSVNHTAKTIQFRVYKHSPKTSKVQSSKILNCSFKKENVEK